MSLKEEARPESTLLGHAMESKPGLKIARTSEFTWVVLKREKEK